MISKNETIPDGGQAPPEPNASAVEKFWSSALSSLDPNIEHGHSGVIKSLFDCLFYCSPVKDNGIQYLWSH